MFEQINESIAATVPEDSSSAPGTKAKNGQKTFAEKKKDASAEALTLYEDVRNYVLSLGDNITENQLKHYVAFKKIKNIVCVEILKNWLMLYLKLDVRTVDYEKGFTRDTAQIGHYGTGNVEVTIRNRADFEKAKVLLDRAYNEN